MPPSSLTEYTSWYDAKQRCHDPYNGQYRDYGGRGITMWWVWRNDFNAFYMYIGPKPTPHAADGKYTLDRIDNDGGYVPGNVRWATRVEQANNVRNNVNLTYKGRTQTMAQWGKELGIRHETIWWRVQQGWSTEKVLSQKNEGARYVTYRGHTQSLGKWCNDLGLNYNRTYYRLRNGWTVEEAFALPRHCGLSIQHRYTPAYKPLVEQQLVWLAPVAPHCGYQ